MAELQHQNANDYPVNYSLLEVCEAAPTVDILMKRIKVLHDQHHESLVRVESEKNLIEASCCLLRKNGASLKELMDKGVDEDEVKEVNATVDNMEVTLKKWRENLGEHRHISPDVHPKQFQTTKELINEVGPTTGVAKPWYACRFCQVKRG